MTSAARHNRREKQKQARRARKAGLPLEAVERADYVYGDPAVTDGFIAERAQTLTAASDHYDRIVDDLRRRGAPDDIIATTQHLAGLARLWDSNIGAVDQALGEQIARGLILAESWQPGMR